MEHYAGLDVSLKEISICVVDHDGKAIARGTCPADPEGVAGWFRNRSLTPHRIVHESGMLSIWLQRGMTRLGLPTHASMPAKHIRACRRGSTSPMLPMPKAWRSSRAPTGLPRSISVAKKPIGSAA